jgi:hypothetical protein
MADQNYFLDIIYQGTTYTFPITPRFFPSLQFNWIRNGFETSVIDTVPVHGWYSEADQDSTIADWNILTAIAQNGTFVAMTFRKADNTVIYRYLNATITDLKMDDSDGGYVNHVEFEFTLREERGVTFPGLVDGQFEDETIQDTEADGTVKKRFRRRVLATGVRGIVANAMSFVLALEPNLSHQTHKSIRVINYVGTVEGVWEYDQTPDLLNGLKRWVERTTYLPGIRVNKFYRNRGTPVLIQGGYTESMLRVTGTIERYDDNFETISNIVHHFDGNVFAKTPVVFPTSPEIGGIYIAEWDSKDPTIPLVYGLTYSYTIAYGEANPVPAPAPRPRDGIVTK